jgi:hypothetical protein
MVGIDARPHVAGMAKYSAIGDFTVAPFEHDLMNQPLHFVYLHRSVAV